MSKNRSSGKPSSFSGERLNALQDLGAAFGIQTSEPAEEEKDSESCCECAGEAAESCCECAEEAAPCCESAEETSEPCCESDGACCESAESCCETKEQPEA